MELVTTTCCNWSQDQQPPTLGPRPLTPVRDSSDCTGLLCNAPEWYRPLDELEECVCPSEHVFRDGDGREGGESRHLYPPGARRQQLSSQVSGSYLCCSFQREINDLVKTSHAPCCGLGPSQRSCSAEPFYKPATIYTPNEVLINYCTALPGGGRVNTSF